MTSESSGGWLRGAQPPTSESDSRFSGEPITNGQVPPGTPTGTPTPAPVAPAHAAPPPRSLPGSGEKHRHVLVAIVLDRPGVLNRVASLMRARNFNIESLAVSHTDQPDISRMTITLFGDDVAVEQAAKQLYRLIDVLKVQDVTAEPTVEHELALVKVRATDRNRAEVLKVVELSKGRVVDVSPESLIVEVTGTEAEVDALVGLVRGFGIKELVRTGTVVMSRGAQSIQESSGRWRRGAPPRTSEGDERVSAEGASSREAGRP